MLKTALSIEEFLQKSGTACIVDVRSPSEFSSGHIPGAFSIPLFSDREHAEIGTLYKQKSRIDAVMHGLDAAGPKMKTILNEIISLKDNTGKPDIMLHCFRGGLRSQSVRWLLELAEIEAPILSGGYKSWRRYAQNLFEKDYRLIILSGQTGCGKTAVLNEMEKSGEQIIDLEALANHRGSVFGGVGKGPQPTTQQFENNLAERLLKMNTEKRIWIENESPLIGSVYIPKPVIDKMRNAPIIQISLPSDEREKRILREYGNFDPKEMEPLILRLKKFLGGSDCKRAVESLYNGNLHETVSILTAYYDKTYTHYQKKYNRPADGSISFNKDRPDRIAAKLIQKAGRLGL